MLTKEAFVNIMEIWASLNDDIDKLDSVVNELFGGSVWEPFYRFDDLVERTLHDCMDDRDDWVAYFAFERGFDLSKPCVEDAEGNTIDTSTWGAVYDLIMEDKHGK